MRRNAARAVHKPVIAAAAQGAAFEVIEADGTFTGAITASSLQMVRQTKAEPGLRMVSVLGSASHRRPRHGKGH
jgi:hypothetical protein